MHNVIRTSLGLVLLGLVPCTAQATTDDDLIYSLWGVSRDGRHVLFNRSFSQGGIGGGSEIVEIYSARTGKLTRAVTLPLSEVDEASGEEQVKVPERLGDRRKKLLNRRYRPLPAQELHSTDSDHEFQGAGLRLRYTHAPIKPCVDLPAEFEQQAMDRTCRFRRKVEMARGEGGWAVLFERLETGTPRNMADGTPYWGTSTLRDDMAWLSADGKTLIAVLNTGDAYVDTEPLLIPLPLYASRANNTGMRLYKKKLAIAAAAFRRAAVIYPAHLHAAFNWACALTRMGQLDQALVALKAFRAAHPKGFRRRVIKDPDLAPLRAHPAFQKLLVP